MFAGLGCGGSTAGVDIGDNIANSLMLDSASSQYLSRTPGSPTDGKKWTFNAKIKLGLLMGSQELYSCGPIGGTSRTYISIQSNALRFHRGVDGVSVDWDWTTVQLLRDPGAWFDLIVIYDSTQGTAANRLLAYINNTLLSGTFSPTITLNAVSELGSAAATRIGAHASGQYYDGYLANVIFVDGQALTPSDFGRTSADTGQWVNKTYAGTYGNNGFKLDFANSADLGNDVSGNNNDWTLNGGISSANQYTDTPTNSYAVLNNITASNNQTEYLGNLKQVGTTAWGNTRSTLALPTTGFWYAEATLTTTNYAFIGLVRDTSSMTSYVGQTTDSWAYRTTGFYRTNGSDTGTPASTSSGKTVGVLWDATNKKLYFRNSDSTAWFSSGDPDAGTGYGHLITGDGPFFFGASGYETDTYWHWNFGQRAWVIGTTGWPTGTQALCTANLPTPAIINPSLHFQAATYTGNGGAVYVSDNVGTPSVAAVDIPYSAMLSSASSQYFAKRNITPTNNRKATISCWVKRAALATDQYIFVTSSLDVGSNPTNYTSLYFSTDDKLYLVSTSSASEAFASTRVFRDTSRFYHFVLSIDCTNTIVSCYVDGVEIAYASRTNPTNTDPRINRLDGYTRLGLFRTAEPRAFDGYLANFIFVDGQALPPSDFGQLNATTNQWVPKAYAGTYGANGFFLDFAEAAATAGSNAGLGKDISGNANYWTTNGSIGATNRTKDTPTHNAYVFSELTKKFTCSISKGNVTVSTGPAGSGVNYALVMSTNVLPRTGLFYWETKLISTGGNDAAALGFIASDVDTAAACTGAGNDLLYQIDPAGSWRFGGVSTSYAGVMARSVNDVIQFAYDATNRRVWVGRNGTWANSGVPASGTGYVQILPNKDFFIAQQHTSASGVTVFDWNFGQQTFAYTPPTGFNALNSQYMPAVSSFGADLIWIKGRSGATDNVIVDTVRGVTNKLITNTTAAEVADPNVITAVLDGGYVVGNTAAVNTLAATYVGWSWKGGGAAVSNTSGSITSSVSANTTAGISIVTYTGTGANATVGHGLGVAPKLVIAKNRSIVAAWRIHHTSLSSAANTLYFDTSAQTAAATDWNSTFPTSTVFSLGSNNGINGNGNSCVALCFAEVEGFSKIGSYTGNGSADGPFVYCGFKPRWILMKQSSAAGNDWFIWDSARNTYNVMNARILVDSSAAEQTSLSAFDFDSNGFKLRETNAAWNGSGSTYVFIAFAEAPMKYATGR